MDGWVHNRGMVESRGMCSGEKVGLVKQRQGACHFQRDQSVCGRAQGTVGLLVLPLGLLILLG